ncbi:Myb-like DNA-binding domain containing protein [Tritrichomonas foetus]|uniref:Myb-like DNA-binding domain containing protein n=1 Tax=Tritrichomonas foetus TaxID=1144522 RepID=A0A1J4L0N8_9EUKA|nr:Myb-like DNA-binding domain containing protein [Tritrichomonas foetus]|eukprot:OHT15437.1 Myb-like DNA-binding domain containing protein [Tritrichomonas foetus]
MNGRFNKFDFRNSTRIMNTKITDINNSSFIKEKFTRAMFSAAEDQLLIELHDKYGENWRKISELMPKRSTRQCKERYSHYLSPDISQTQWTIEEDTFLKNKVSEIGKRWKALESFFTGRTEINIRNRWNVLNRREKKELRNLLKKKKKYSIDSLNSNSFLCLEENYQSNPLVAQTNTASCMVNNIYTNSNINYVQYYPVGTRPKEVPEENEVLPDFFDKLDLYDINEDYFDCTALFY